MSFRRMINWRKRFSCFPILCFRKLSTHFFISFYFLVKNCAIHRNFLIYFFLMLEICFKFHRWDCWKVQIGKGIVWRNRDWELKTSSLCGLIHSLFRGFLLHASVSISRNCNWKRNLLFYILKMKFLNKQKKKIVKQISSLFPAQGDICVRFMNELSLMWSLASQSVGRAGKESEKHTIYCELSAGGSAKVHRMHFLFLLPSQRIIYVHAYIFRLSLPRQLFYLPQNAISFEGKNKVYSARKVCEASILHFSFRFWKFFDWN